MALTLGQITSWSELWWLQQLDPFLGGNPRRACIFLDAGFEWCFCDLFWCELMNLSRNPEAGWEGVKCACTWYTVVKNTSFGSRQTLSLNQLCNPGFRFPTVK